MYVSGIIHCGKSPPSCSVPRIIIRGTLRLLRESASVISGPLAELMNESIKQCKYPSRWKMGQVTPLFKKNDELNRENYRPVTV